MGKGNICVFGEYEGLYYVDHDQLHVYCDNEEPENEPVLLGSLSFQDLASGRYYFDDVSSSYEQEYFEETLQEDLMKKFPSLTKHNEWIDYSRRAILENRLFYICIADNDWSQAVMLVQKDDDQLTGLQKGQYQKFLAGIREALFMQFEEIGTYGGAWTSGRLKREEAS